MTQFLFGFVLGGLFVGAIVGIWWSIECDRRRMAAAFKRVHEATEDLFNCLADIPKVLGQALHEVAHDMARCNAATTAIYAHRSRLGPPPESGHYVLCHELAEVALKAADSVKPRQ